MDDLAVLDGFAEKGVYSAYTFDPVTSIVLPATAEDVDTVIIDGEIQKRGGRLVDDSFAAKADAAVGIVDRLVPTHERRRAR